LATSSFELIHMRPQDAVQSLARAAGFKRGSREIGAGIRTIARAPEERGGHPLLVVGPFSKGRSAA
jgi:uncharacterized membrane protein